MTLSRAVPPEHAQFSLHGLQSMHCHHGRFSFLIIRLANARGSAVSGRATLSARPLTSLSPGLGEQVSRRSLRRAGLHGYNADLGHPGRHRQIPADHGISTKPKPRLLLVDIMENLLPTLTTRHAAPPAHAESSA